MQLNGIFCLITHIVRIIVQMRETENCAVKLTNFIIWEQAFVGYCSLCQVQSIFCFSHLI